MQMLCQRRGQAALRPAGVPGISVAPPDYMRIQQRIRIRRPLLAVLLAAGSFAAGCGEQGVPETGEQDAEALAAEGRTPPAMRASAEVAAERIVPPDRVYPNLTNYEWYAHGQPLLFEGRSYSPDDVVRFPTEDAARVGEYQGVDVYRLADEDDGRLYVPVTAGYWLPFVPSPSAGDAEPSW